ncbi:unnamed protein product [Allacma fusca]|uniref:Uncharacterized protein n=1 Tax=Allacma fusca TaxID=39272 RepID=A0A8J2LHV0_9HEXA|nr:unnamed protein product [Allacma fusca]
MSESVVAEYLDQGLPIERIPRRKSITDFVELETIRFRGNFVMDPLMLSHCLPRVPKLRQIYFFWNESLSAPLLRDYLGHLERIVIWNLPDHKFQVAMAQVAEMFPEVSSLTFSICRLWRTILPDICESFPKLTALTLAGKCDFSCLSGMSESVVTEYFDQGLTIERILRRKSLKYFVVGDH